MPSPLISTAQLALEIDTPTCVVVDTRHELANPQWGREAYSNGHLPGAIFFSIDHDLAAEKNGKNGRHPLPAPDAFAHTLGQKGIDRTSKIVIYDQGSAMYAGRLWWMLRWMGHDEVYVLDGGYARWTQEARSVDTVIPTRAQREYVGRAQESMRVNMIELRKALTAPESRIIDARAPERFRGEVEPIDPVAGHIPGAINRPFTQNLRDGVFKPATELRAEFEAILASRSPQQVIHQCGSGVSALANMLAMEHAGLSGSRLYPGSWSEWCTHPENPIARA
ncbi:MAG: sulfurtransferase [Burkholderiales bacterium]|nr:MAG: sulfurtransferase [Burkholderiales bacterium]